MPVSYTHLDVYKRQGLLFTEDIYEEYINEVKSRKTVVKALCLHKMCIRDRSCDCPFFLCFSWVFGHKVYLNCRTNVYFLWRCTTINELMINEQVRDREVRVISSDGEQLGIMSSKERCV